MYIGGCIFVNHASRYVQIQRQVCIISHETIRAKEKLELHYHDSRVIPQNIYHIGTDFIPVELSNHMFTFKQVASEPIITMTMLFVQYIHLYLYQRQYAIFHNSLDPCYIRFSVSMAINHVVHICKHVSSPRTQISYYRICSQKLYGHTNDFMIYMSGFSVFIF